MKIALVLPASPGYSETFFRSKIKGLQSHGNNVVLITAKKDMAFDLCEQYTHPKIYKNGALQLVVMLWVFLGLSLNYRAVWAYYKLEQQEQTPIKRILEKIYLNATLLKLKVDWLHFGFATMAINRELVAESINAKMAVSFRGFDMAIYPLKHKACYHLLWTKVDKIHTISDDLLNLAYKFGLPKSIEVAKITPAIDVSFFEGHDVYFEEQINFLTVARLHWKKGLVQTLEALGELKRQGINFTYTIVGDGVDFERIAFAVYELGLSENVFFVGKKNREEVLLLYKQSNYYLQYSISEGFCNAVLEAQAMGLLCIVSDAEGLSENVIHEHTGWVVPKNNYKLLVKRIQAVIKTPETLKQEFSENAKKRVRDYFTIQQQQKKFIDFYTK